MASGDSVDRESVVRTENLTESFHGCLFLKDVHLRVERSRIVSVLAQSGGGKTTLLRCLDLPERLDRGAVVVRPEGVCTAARSRKHG